MRRQGADHDRQPMLQKLANPRIGPLLGRVLFSPWSVVVMALLVAAILFFPWKVAEPRVYEGFDPNLTFVDEQGDGTQSGQVQMDQDRVVITATEESQPVLHLVTTVNSFSAEFDVAIQEQPASQLWREVSVIVEAPPEAVYASVLLGTLNGSVSFDDVLVEAVPDPGAEGGAILFAEDFEDPQLSGWFTSDGVDRVRKDEITADHGLRIIAPAETEEGAYTTQLIGPLPGDARTYRVSALVQFESGPTSFKLAVGWANEDREIITYSPEWNDWTPYAQPNLPLRVRLWYPANGYAIDLRFVNHAEPELLAGSNTWGAYSSLQTLGSYEPGSTYHVRVDWEPQKRGAFSVLTPDGQTLAYEIDDESDFGLFQSSLVNLSIDSSSPRGSQNSVELTNFRIELPSQTRLFAYASDWRLLVLTSVVVIWFAGYLTYYLVPALAGRLGTLRGTSVRQNALRVVRSPLFVFSVISVPALLALYALSASIDGHPFDRLSQENWTYVTDKYGLDDLYARSSMIPDSAVRGGGPAWAPTEIGYPPGIAYFYLLIGKAWHLISGPIVPMGDQMFQIFWKTSFSAFILVNAGLMFYILRRVVRAPLHWALIPVGLYALNPAVIFDNAVWGESDALLTAALLVSVLGLVTNRPRLVWSFLVIALLIKQTALVAAPVIAVVALWRFGLRRTLVAASFGVIVGFVLISPLLFLGYHPATIYSTTAGKLLDVVSQATAFSTQISGDTFPIWSLFTGFDGLSGYDRIGASDATLIPGLGISYSTAGLLLIVLVAAISTITLWRNPQARSSPQPVFLFLGLIFLAYVAFATRTSGRYLTLALPFLLLSLQHPLSFRGYPASLRALWIPAVASLVSFVSMYGLFMVIATRGEWPSFLGLGNPSTNALSNAVYRVYTADVFITIFACLLLVATLASLAQVVSVGLRQDRPVREPGEL